MTSTKLLAPALALLLTLALALTLALRTPAQAAPLAPPAPATVAGVPVPAGLACAEDETIWWTGEADDALGCVHQEAVAQWVARTQAPEAVAVAPTLAG